MTCDTHDNIVTNGNSYYRHDTRYLGYLNAFIVRIGSIHRRNEVVYFFRRLVLFIAQNYSYSLLLPEKSVASVPTQFTPSVVKV